MNFTKKIRYGFLFSLYVYRAGRATVSEAAHELKLKKPFLQQIAGALKQAGILTSTRGPGGGYSLKDGTTMLEIYLALDTYERPLKMSNTTQEGRALIKFLFTNRLVMHKQLNRTVKNVMQELVANEVATLARADVMRNN